MSSIYTYNKYVIILYLSLRSILSIIMYMHSVSSNFVVSGAEVAQAAMIKAAALRQVQAQVVANASGFNFSLLFNPSMPQVIHMSSAEEKKRDEEKPQKSASDIAKEMMKWAKKQEKAKVHMSLKPLVKPLETKSALETVASVLVTIPMKNNHFLMPCVNRLVWKIILMISPPHRSLREFNIIFLLIDTEMLATTPQRHLAKIFYLIPNLVYNTIIIRISHNS
uniref:Auxin efflux carrier component n=1 Tax=Heterorhabditis bacteriophora TaxID=37862 RepID=A0A1I7X803_HETBA